MTKPVAKRVAILGSTGSVGCQTLDVVRSLADHVEVEVLAAGSNAALLVKQAVEFVPNAVVIADKSQYSFVKEALQSLPVKVYAGQEALTQIVEMESIDLVLNALLGLPALAPGLTALKAGKVLAQANKEAMVMAGRFLREAGSRQGGAIIPVDSEHSAIFQCFLGETDSAVSRIILTASGGPFRGKQRDFLAKVTKHDALQHPNWNMGDKITVDSASLMNKGLEMIAARWLFDLPHEQIDVIIHPQSVIHGMVAFADGTMKAVMGYPDMRIPIQYAMTFPKRLPASVPALSLSNFTELSFEMPDLQSFPSLTLARHALQADGNAPCVLNAANEVAVEAFLHEKITFLQIPAIVEKCLTQMQFVNNPSLDDIYLTDAETRNLARELVISNH